MIAELSWHVLSSKYYTFFKEGKVGSFQHLNVLMSSQQALSGVSSQWLRANGPDVRTTWPAPGLHMLSSTPPVMQSRGEAICRFSSMRFIANYFAEKNCLE